MTGQAAQIALALSIVIASGESGDGKNSVFG
jgi:hypothetical protein